MRIAETEEKKEQNDSSEEIHYYVQSFISNIAAPKSLSELEYFIDQNQRYNVEDVLQDNTVFWTVPRWTKIGDVVFFMHSKTANASLTALRTSLKRNSAVYSKARYDEMMEWISRGLRLHKQYGGKIFAVAKIASLPQIDYENDYSDIELHFKSRIFAEINDINILNVPIDISEFRDFIMVSRQSAITPVFGDEFNRLRDIIRSNNTIARYYIECTSSSLPLTKINEKNWYLVSNEYRNTFALEIQFRTFYVNYFLKEISDIKKIYRECRCIKEGIPDSFIDNIIMFRGKYLPIEVKLSVKIEKNLNDQLKKYCYDDEIYLEEKKQRKISNESVYRNRVLVIDTNNIYIYKYEDDKLFDILELGTIVDDGCFEQLKDIIYENL